MKMLVCHPKAVVPALDAGTHCPIRSTEVSPEALKRLQAPMDPGDKPRDDKGDRIVAVRSAA